MDSLLLGTRLVAPGLRSGSQQGVCQGCRCDPGKGREMRCLLPGGNRQAWAGEGCLQNIGVPNLSRTSSELSSSEMKELTVLVVEIAAGIVEEAPEDPQGLREHC